MGKKSPPPQPPDLSPISDAQLQIARESNDLAREFMGMSKDQFKYFQENAKEELTLARQQADRLFEFQNKAFESDEEAKEFARQVGQTQIDAMNLQQDYAKKDRERYEQVFLPMQDRYIAEAEGYDTAARREEAAGAAMADTQRQAESARANADQRLRSMGLDPSQMRSASLLQTQDVMGAAQQAAAANQERLRIENQGRAMRADAMNLGMGLPAQAAAGFGGSGASGAGAVGAAQAGQGATLAAIQGGAGVGSQAMGFRSGALQNLSNLTGSPMQWAGMGNQMYGTSAGGLQSAGNTINQGYQNQQQQWKAGQEQSQQMISNVMGAAGMMAMMAEGGEVVRSYAEGGEVNRYYAEGDFVPPDRVRPGFNGGVNGGVQIPGYDLGNPFPTQTRPAPMTRQAPSQGPISQPAPDMGPMRTGGFMPPDQFGRGGGGGGGTVTPTQFDAPGSGGAMDPIALGLGPNYGRQQNTQPRGPIGMPAPEMGPMTAGMQRPDRQPMKGWQPPQQQQRGGIMPPGQFGGMPGRQFGGRPDRPGGVRPDRPGGFMPGTQPTMPYNPQQPQMGAEGGYMYAAEGTAGMVSKLVQGAAKSKRADLSQESLAPVANFTREEPNAPLLKPNTVIERDPSLQERLRKGLMVAQLAPENSWSGGQSGAGQYMDAMSGLKNKDYLKDVPGTHVSNFAEGGSPMRARGAIPSRQSRDEIPAYLAEGEYVLPADVVRALGIEKLDKLVAKYHRDNA